jgi:vacuolar protein sorting-associated protein 72
MMHGVPFTRSLSAPDPVPLVCAITGLPAKYKDPLTGKPYANAQAFKALRGQA